MRRLHRALMCPAASLAVTVLAAAQQPSSGLEVAWRPALPRQGSLIHVVAAAPAREGDSVVAVLGELAGEPLHFEPRPGGGFRTLAGVPLDAPDTVSARLVFNWASAAADTLEARVPVAARRGVVERLRTAPEFARPLDSALVARITGERELARDVARRAHDVPRLWAEAFVRPRVSRVTSPFGRRREVNGAMQSPHPGVDLAGAAGAPVRAANRGVVALVADFFYGGISVYLHHGAGLMTVYHHLSAAAVAEGDTVERGRLVGRVGATGRVTGPHLHWEAHYGRFAVAPDDLLTLPATPRRD